MVVYRDMSRINHKYVPAPPLRGCHLLTFVGSCTPNIFQEFDFASFTCNLFAFRPIKAGEELVTPYIDPFLPFRERLKILWWRFYFVCDCKACTDGEASDARRDLIKNAALEDRVTAYIRQPPYMPTMSEPIALELISGLKCAWNAAIVEGFEGGKIGVSIMQLIWEMYMIVGEERKALEVGVKLVEDAKKRYHANDSKLDFYADIEEIRAMRVRFCSRALR